MWLWLLCKAWNVQAASDFSLDGPKARVVSMVAGIDMLFAEAEVNYRCSGLWLLSYLIQTFFFGS